MAQQIERVRPGDLITASSMNQLLEILDSLESRVHTLEVIVSGSEGVAIIGLLPSGPVRINQELRVLGRNFGLPTSNVVTIDGLRVDQFKPGSNETQLIFNVPLIQGVTEQGKLVTLTLSNQQGSAATTLTVLPAQSTVPTGSVEVFLSQSPPGQITAGSNFIFVFTVKAITTLDETYALSPTVVATDPGWQAVVVNNEGEPISPPEIQIFQGVPPLGSTRNVRVRLTVPNVATDTTAQLRLAVTSKQNPSGLTGSSGNNMITVGGAPPFPQDEIIITPGTVFQPGSKVGNVAVIPPTGALVPINFKVTFKDLGTYTVTIPTFQNNQANLWSATLLISSPTIITQSPNADVTILLGVSAQAGAPDTNMVVRIILAGSTTVFGEVSQPVRINA